MLSAEDVEPVLSEVVKERFVIIRIEFNGDRPGILLIANVKAEPRSERRPQADS